jgi:hypothetical protein
VFCLLITAIGLISSVAAITSNFTSLDTIHHLISLMDYKRSAGDINFLCDKWTFIAGHYLGSTSFKNDGGKYYSRTIMKRPLSLRDRYWQRLRTMAADQVLSRTRDALL